MKQVSLLLLALFAFSAQAQTFKFSVKGSIVEEGSDDALPAVKVELLTADSVRVSHAATNEQGAFLLKAKKTGKYIVRAEMTGCEPLFKNVEFTSKKADVDLGKLTLKALDIRLGEAQVTALSRMMTAKGDTLVFHTKALRLPPGASLAALMKELPGISMDKDGNLTYQGKAVSQILVDGKPFFGDVSSALANMPTDAVQDVKMYEKTDEEKEFRGELDDEKATVVDLKIKKEYKSNWMTNLDLGGGTDERYIGKVFSTNFTDRRRTAVYAQVNNISQNQRVDENGNWSYWGSLGGIYTYRKAGAMLQWDNGKGNTEAGNLRVNGNVEVKHNDAIHINDNNRETFLGAGNSQYSYAHSMSRNCQKEIRTDADLTYNIDSLNRLNVNVRYSYNTSDGSGESVSSTYRTLPEWSDNLASSLLDGTLPDELKQQAIYAHRNSNLGNSNQHNASLYANYTHRFRKPGRTLSASFNSHLNKNNSEADELSYYRYFRPEAPRQELTNRQFYHEPDESYGLSGSLTFADKVNEHVRLSAYYIFSHDKNSDERDVYQLDRYDRYADPSLPVGFRPTPGDSLDFVRNIENSYYSDSYTNSHGLRPSFQGTWGKLETTAFASFNFNNDHLYYDRDGVLHRPSRNHTGVGVYSTLKYKFTDQNYIQMQYRGNTHRPSLRQLLPVSDTSDPMSESVNNPNLKAGWSNSAYIFGRLFNPRRGDNYSMNLGFGNQSNEVVSTEQTDPVTGYRRFGRTNVNGNYWTWVSFSTEQPLDTARHWMLTARAYFNFNHETGFVGAMGNALGLSTINSYSPTVNLGLRWRKDIWSVSLRGMWEGRMSRYVETPQYNQDGHTYEVSLSPQADLPFGMKINTSLTFYTRHGYADDLLNHDQWIWNASVSQSFLKNKALTLQLEAVDILQQRTSEYSSLNAQSRFYNRTECFLSYVMLHAIYKFNIGGKK